jgi:hypothetical protein
MAKANCLLWLEKFSYMAIELSAMKRIFALEKLSAMERFLQ